MIGRQEKGEAGLAGREIKQEGKSEKRRLRTNKRRKRGGYQRPSTKSYSQTRKKKERRGIQKSRKEKVLRQMVDN